jgi:hypothetical protein
MALDQQIIQLIKQTDKRQSTFRQRSIDSMYNTKSQLENLDNITRYNTKQNNTLKGTLDNLTKQVYKGNNNKNNNNTDKILTDLKSIESSSSETVVDKLDEIRDLMQDQRDIFKKYFSDMRRDKSMEVESDDKKSKKQIATIVAATQKSSKDTRQQTASSGGSGFGAAALALAPVLGPLGLISNLGRGASRLFSRGANAFKNLTGRTPEGLKGLQQKGTRQQAKLDASKSKMAKQQQSVTRAQEQLKRLQKADPNSKLAKNTQDLLNKRQKDLSKTVKQSEKLAKDLGKTQKTISNVTKSLAPPKLPSSVAGRAAAGLGKGAAATAKGLGKALGPIGLVAGVGFEAYDTFNLLTMDEKTRKQELNKIADDLSEKGPLGRAWYALNNQSKTIAATYSTIAETADLNNQTKLLDEFNEEKARELELRKQINKENETQEVIEKKLADIGDLKDINFNQYESKAALNSFLSTPEGRKYIEQRALKEGRTKIQARREILEDYEFSDPGTESPIEQKQEQVLPAVTLSSSLENNTKAFKTLSEDLKNLIEQQQPVVMNNSNTSINAPSMDYGERQRLSVAG